MAFIEIACDFEIRKFSENCSFEAKWMAFIICHRHSLYAIVFLGKQHVLFRSFFLFLAIFPLKELMMGNAFA